MVRKLCLVVAILMCCACQLKAQTYYVATTGSDSGAGTLENPFRTIPKAISVATTPGTTIYVRGGTYAYSTTITLSRNGTSANMYKLFAYPGERAFLDFSAMPVNSNNRGIRVSGSYWYIKGFDIWKAGDNGMNISGSNNVVEFCSFSENSDTGLQLGGGASNNQIINCDSYFNADPGNGNADGFAPKLDVGSGNYFYGCRAWQNSDDGWDGYIRPRPTVVPTTTLENCWCFKNGYLKTGTASTGNGNGYKMGGSDSANLSHTMILKNCLSFQNRVKGFDQNNNHGSMTLLNCTSFSNGTNYGMSGPIDIGSVMTLKNCVSAGTGSVSLLPAAVQATNSWNPPFIVTNADFVSIDTAGVRGPRNADGSLPALNFMHLSAGSDLINAGTNVGLPFNGPAPDLGCFETSEMLFSAISIVPSSVNFGNIAIYSAVQDTVKITSVGLATLHVDSIRTYESQFSATPGFSATLPIGDSLLVSVAFHPTSNGMQGGSLVVYSDAPTSPDTVDLAGIAVQSGFSAEPNPVSLGNVTIGSNATDTTAVTNTGTGTLRIDSVKVFGGEFNVNPSGSSNITSGNSEGFVVAFNPTSIGLQSGSVVFFSNAPSSPDSISVAGNGTSTNVLVNVPISAGWNLVSNPIIADNDSVSRLFPNASFNFAYAFAAGSGYEEQYRVQKGVGYWEKFPVSATNLMTGLPILADTIQMTEGWNIIGSISFPVDTSEIVTVPSNLRASAFFGFSGSFSPVAIIEPGNAYWVKAFGSGSFILHSSVSAKLPSRNGNQVPGRGNR